jgi:hypothetical protein
MSDPSERVECSVHGPGVATFTCQHLRLGSACGFFRASEDLASDPYPDAWCSACEEVFVREDGWNDRSVEFAKISVLCPGCYEDSRHRNERLPTGLDMNVGRLDDAAFARLVHTSCEATIARQDSAQSRTSFLDEVENLDVVVGERGSRSPPAQ